MEKINNFFCNKRINAYLSGKNGYKKASKYKAFLRKAALLSASLLFIAGTFTSPVNIKENEGEKNKKVENTNNFTFKYEVDGVLYLSQEKTINKLKREFENRQAELKKAVSNEILKSGSR